MLSYRHAYHAGSPADVLKHAVLAFILRFATMRRGPLYVLDTHAGAGAYDLDAAPARKTGEAETGILRLWQTPPPWPDLLEPFASRLEAADSYPGSPLIAGWFLRPRDRLDLIELHPTDHAALAERFAGVPGVRVSREDGLAAMARRLPPPERRAVVLIDPSYEIKTEYADVVTALAAAQARFMAGTFLLWYPVIDRRRTTTLLDSLIATGIRGQYRLELGLRPDSEERGMTGSGLVVVNPPYTLPAAAGKGLPWLAEKLDATGPVVAEWLVPE
jgi:23S rRNA (adenine2030-N6)-methyltransferase